MARAVDQIEHQAKSMKTTTEFSDSTIQKVSSETKTWKGTRSHFNDNNLCYRCGKTNHNASQCRFKEAECHNCGKRGHIKAVCRSSKVTDRPNPGRDVRNSHKHYSTEKLKWINNGEESVPANLANRAVITYQCLHYGTVYLHL